MKGKIAIIVFLFVTLSVYGQSDRPIPLDTAIMVAAERIDGRLETGTKIALINFNSTSDRFSSHVLNELEGYLVDSGVLEVIDRKEIDLRRNELNFQMSGEVSDESMQSLGRTLGAQSIVSGSLAEIDNIYRVTIRVLNVESGRVEVQYRQNIIIDRTVKALLNIEKTTGEKVGTGALNIIFGLGSYLEGDIWGGVTITAGYALAIGLIVIEVTALDWDSPAVNVPGTIGLGVAGLSLAYGFARPFIYNRSPRLAEVMDNTQFKIVQTPNNNGIGTLGYQLSYTIKF
jgi:TolB-like protein